MIPRSAIAVRTSGTSHPISPCSSVSTPASTESRIPSEPSACEATLKPSRCVSSTIASISARVSWVGPTSSSATVSAPVDMILTKSAPWRICSRTALRISSGPSASRYMPGKVRPPGQLAATIWPHSTSRGPGTSPRSIASRRSNSERPKLPRSRTVVMPPSSMPRAASTSPYGCSSGPSDRSSEDRCTWASISPGISVRPSMSTVGASGGAGWSPTALIRPRSTTTVTPSRAGAPVPSTRRAPVSAITARSPGAP